MMQKRIQWLVAAVLLIGVVLAGVFTARGMRPTPTATVDIGRVQTQAVAVFASGLTGTAEAQPASTATKTATPTKEAAQTGPTASTGTASTSSVSPTPSCYRLQYVRDVTIPDNTILTPAQVFTKTWQVQNNGTCAWRPGFKLILVGGNAMGGSPFNVEAAVTPGAKVEISVKMVAPTNQTGIITGTWRMSDDAGTLFGDALTVVIVVGNPAGAPPTVGTAATP